jgi:hypothetical protein
MLAGWHVVQYTGLPLVEGTFAPKCGAFLASDGISAGSQILGSSNFVFCIFTRLIPTNANEFLLPVNNNRTPQSRV